MTFYDKNRLLIKGLLIGFFIMIMLIPAAMIGNLVRERAVRHQDVTREVSSKWGGRQTIGGPVLLLPYTYSYDGNDKQRVTVRKTAYILPQSLRIEGSVDPEERPRSLYKVLLYTGKARLSGSFGPLPLAQLGIEPSQVVWNEAKILIGLSDPASLSGAVGMTWDGTAAAPEPGLPENTALGDGLSAQIPLQEGGANQFDISLSVRGTENLYFLPLGKTTDLNLRSSWKHPSFDGRYLPDRSAISDKDGFSASWKIIGASRGYPQAWTDKEVDLEQAAFGVRLIQPVDGYAKTERSLKYSILFIALSFIIFFFLEILQKRRVHPLQYLLVGFALCVFYTLLLSISEYWGFNNAYTIATIATVGLVGAYTKSLFHSWKTGLGFSLALGGLYGYIFILIQLEDYALLFGSIGLFVILAILMYVSRRIDWYGSSPDEPEHSPVPTAPAP